MIIQVLYFWSIQNQLRPKDSAKAYFFCCYEILSYFCIRKSGFPSPNRHFAVFLCLSANKNSLKTLSFPKVQPIFLASALLSSMLKIFLSFSQSIMCRGIFIDLVQKKHFCLSARLICASQHFSVTDFSMSDLQLPIVHSGRNVLELTKKGTDLNYVNSETFMNVNIQKASNCSAITHGFWLPRHRLQFQRTLWPFADFEANKRQEIFSMSKEADSITFKVSSQRAYPNHQSHHNYPHIHQAYINLNIIYQILLQSYPYPPPPTLRCPNNNHIPIPTLSPMTPTFIEYPTRFTILLCYSLASFINGMCWVTTTPISTSLQSVYGITAFEVSLMPMSYLVCYLLLSFPANWMIDGYGSRASVALGAVLTAVGCWLRMGSGWGWVLGGQVLNGVAQPFIINAAMRVATTWFLPTNRSLAMAVLTVSNTIGSAVGFYMPSYFVKQVDTPSQIRENFHTLLAIQAGIAFLAALLVLLFFKQRPPTAPSLGSLTPKTNFKQSLLILFGDRQCVKLSLTFGTINAVYNFYGSLLDDILHPFGISSDSISTLGLVLMCSGIVSSTLLCRYIQRTLNYQLPFRILGILGLLSAVCYPLLLHLMPSPPLIPLIVLSAFQGCIFVASQPVCIDYACDVLFPISEAQITGFMIFLGQVLGIFVMSFTQEVFGLGDKTLGDEEARAASMKAVLMGGVGLGLGAVVLAGLRGELRRAEVEKGGRGGFVMVGEGEGEVEDIGVIEEEK